MIRTFLHMYLISGHHVFFLTTQAARKAESSAEPGSTPSVGETMGDSEPSAGELEEYAAAEQTSGDSLTVASAEEPENCTISELVLSGEDHASEIYLPADRNSYSPSVSDSEESGPASIVESAARDDAIHDSHHEEVQVATPERSQYDADAAHTACPRFTALEHGIVTCIVEHKDKCPTGASVSEIVHFLSTEGIPFTPRELA